MVTVVWLFFAVFDSLTSDLDWLLTMGAICFVLFCFGAIMTLPSPLRQRLTIRSEDYPLLILRALSGAGTFYLTLLAFRSGALSVTMVLFFTNPLWALFLGALFLKEHLTWERTLCVVTALIGIAVLIRPWGEGYCPEPPLWPCRRRAGRRKQRHDKASTGAHQLPGHLCLPLLGGNGDQPSFRFRPSPDTGINGWNDSTHRCRLWATGTGSHESWISLHPCSRALEPRDGGASGTAAVRILRLN